MLDFIWLIPAIPLGSSLLLGLLGWKIRSRRVVAAVACGAVLLAFLLSALAVWQLGSLADPGGHRVSLGEWIVGGSLQIGEERDAALRVEWAFLLDGLSGLMILVVTGVGFWIHLYSVGYMWEDRGFNRYFAFLNLFTGMMLILVLGSSFPVMFVGWEGVG
ncbi:MAG: NADH-quinone oxidoreductase subunit L, partial [Acidobacteriota bacterium]